MSELTVTDVFTKQIPSRLAEEPDLVRRIDGSYQFRLTGNGGGDWLVDLTRESDHCRQATVDNVGVTITMSVPDFLGLVQGRLNGRMAFMQGKLKVEGDFSLAMKLKELLG